MSEEKPLPPVRPIGTEFEEITETPTKRIITRLKVLGYIYGMDNVQHELIEEISTVSQPKPHLGGNERKAHAHSQDA